MVLLVLLCVVPALVLVFDTAQDERDGALEEARRDSRQLAGLIAADVGGALEGERQLLISLARLPEVRLGRARQCSRSFAVLLRRYPRYANLGAADARGRIFCSALPARLPVNAATRTWFRRAVARRGFAVGEYQVGKITRRRSLNAAHPVVVDGDLRAVVFAALDLDSLARLIARTLRPRQGAIMVADSSGTVLVRLPHPGRYVGRRLPEAAVVRASQRAGGGTVNVTGLDGVQRLYAFESVRGDDGADLRVAVGLSQAAAFGEANDTLRRNLITLAIVGVLACGLAWLIAAPLVVRPHERRMEQADAERDHLEARVRQAERLESIGQLAGGIAHDFNNLLAVIINYTELAARSADGDKQLRERIAQIRDAANRAAELTHQLLVFSRREPVEARVLDLNREVSGLEGLLLSRTLGEHVAIQISLTPDLWPVKADRSQLQQVLLNLAINARDAMPEGGSLAIETANAYLDEAYVRSHAGTLSGRFARLVVSDTGSGMAPEVAEHIFEPFFTTKPKGEGTGLGLATVYGIIRQAGGRIEVYSEPGHGTTFKIYLPAATEDPQAVPPRAAAPALHGEGATVLVVEDEPGVREVTREILAEHGYEVLAAAGAEEALRLLRRRAGPPDLLLTDVIMPEVSGPELAERVRERHGECRVLYMSGYTGEFISRTGALKPGVRLLEKPFGPDSLLRAVADVLGQGPTENGGRGRR